MSEHKKSPAGTEYAPGDRVRVRRGVTDPDFPDLTIGGWAGTVAEADTRSSPPNYLIRWGRETLRAVHPVHRKRAERDGFEIGEMWLGADDLEPDDGTGTGVEQPTNIVTKPLSTADQDDRIRAVFGLTSDDPLPDVGEESLRAFQAYLSGHLRFPVEATWTPPTGPAQRVTVLGLSDPDPDLWADGMCGLLCRAKLKGEGIEIALADCEAKKGSPGRQLVADYGYWFGTLGESAPHRRYPVPERKDQEPCPDSPPTRSSRACSTPTRTCGPPTSTTSPTPTARTRRSCRW